MVPKCRILAFFVGLAFPASRVQHISDLHSKFALNPRWRRKNRHMSAGNIETTKIVDRSPAANQILVL